MSAVTAKSAGSPAERYRTIFEERWRGDGPLMPLRRAALDRFVSCGFPTQRQEDWKYTNLRRLQTRSFTPADKALLALDAKQEHWIDAATRIVLVNGHCLPSLSSSAQPPGVTVVSLGQWLHNDEAGLAQFLSRDAFSPRADSAAGAAQTHPIQARPIEAFEQLNRAFFEDGVVVELADDVQLDEPVYVLHQWNDSASQRMSHPRLIVRAGRNSRCTLIEHFVGPAGIEYFTNGVATLELAEGAAVTHYRLQQESIQAFHIGQIDARLQANARYSSHNIALGASLARVNIATMLEGPGSHATLHGLFAPAGTQHLDSHTRIDHIAAHTSSEEDYRGVAAGRGRGVFNGKVIVHPGAQKTDARQSSRNLLLSPTAEIDTKPELEIYADDVKCSHGATTGQLDATALFYLRSRGLSEAEARSLLIRAFAESILTTIDYAPLRSQLERQLEDRFAVSNEVQS